MKKFGAIFCLLLSVNAGANEINCGELLGGKNLKKGRTLSSEVLENIMSDMGQLQTVFMRADSNIEDDQIIAQRDSKGYLESYTLKPSKSSRRALNFSIRYLIARDTNEINEISNKMGESDPRDHEYLKSRQRELRGQIEATNRLKEKAAKESLVLTTAEVYFIKDILRWAREYCSAQWRNLSLPPESNSHGGPGHQRGYGPMSSKEAYWSRQSNF